MVGLLHCAVLHNYSVIWWQGVIRCQHIYSHYPGHCAFLWHGKSKQPTCCAHWTTHNQTKDTPRQWQSQNQSGLSPHSGLSVLRYTSQNAFGEVFSLWVNVICKPLLHNTLMFHSCFRAHTKCFHSPLDMKRKPGYSLRTCRSRSRSRSRRLKIHVYLSFAVHILDILKV